jgi:hypothetical protein
MMRRYLAALALLAAPAFAQPFSRVTILDLADIAGTLATDDKLFIYDTSASTLKRVELNQICTDYLQAGELQATGDIATDACVRMGDADADTNGDCICRNSSYGLYADTDCDAALDATEQILGTFQGVRVYHSTTQSTTNATWARKTWDTESYDTAGYHDTGSNTERITIPAGLGGYYRIMCSIAWAANATGIRYTAITLNSNTTGGGGTYLDWKAEPTTAADPVLPSAAGTIYALAAGDEIQCHVYQTSGGDLNTNGGSAAFHFSAELVGR